MGKNGTKIWFFKKHGSQNGTGKPRRRRNGESQDLTASSHVFRQMEFDGGVYGKEDGGITAARMRLKFSFADIGEVTWPMRWELHSSSYKLPHRYNNDLMHQSLYTRCRAIKMIDHA